MSAPGAKTRGAWLKVTDPSGQSRTIAVDPVPFHIGRHAENHLILRDSRASRHHASIIEEKGEFFVLDRGSTHGTYVNGQRVERVRLHGGDRITFGFEDSYRLTFEVAEGELHRLLDQMPGPAESRGEAGEHLAKLRAVVEVARALQSGLTTDEVLDAVVDAALAVTKTQRGFLLLKDADTGELRIRVGRDRGGARLPARELTIPTKLIHRALNQRRELLSMNFDPYAAEGIRPDMSVARLELRSVVCVPLVRVRGASLQETVQTSLSDTVGLLYLDSRADAADLSSGNRELLQTLALEASTILENARLLEEERTKQKLEEELNFARTIQQSLLPKRLPATGWFRAAGSCIASHEVGGDYFDVVEIRRDCWSAVVADISGKGVSSALLASLLQGAFLRGAETPEQIRAMLRNLSRFLLERTGGEKYATLFYGVLTPDGRLVWANAAHFAPILMRRHGGIEKLNPTGMPVGLLESPEYETEITKLSPGDRLVVYTDGVSEAQNEQGEFFGDQRLLEAIGNNAALGCADFHGRLLEEVREFTGSAPQRDDITLLVLEYQPEA